MTFFHFLNCLALAYAPYFLVYKYSGLSEYSNVWKCGAASLAYLGTQLAKLMLLATFFPASESEGTQLDVISELMKSLLTFADLAGIYYIITYNWAGKGASRFASAGLGWSVADSLATRLLPFWVGARGVGFDWKYTQMALESNLNLVFFVSVAALVWFWGRSDLPRELRHATAAILGFAVLRSFVFELLIGLMGMESWTLLLVKSVLTGMVCASTVIIYGSIQHRQEYR